MTWPSRTDRNGAAALRLNLCSLLEAHPHMPQVPAVLAYLAAENEGEGPSHLALTRDTALLDERTPAEVLDVVALALVADTAGERVLGVNDDRVASLRSIAGNPNAAPHTLVSLRQRHLPDVRLATAENPNCPTLLLAALAQDRDWRVRQAVAAHPRAPQEVLATLAEDIDAGVREAVLANPHTSPEICRDLLGERPDLPLVHAAARNPRFGPDLVAAWASNPQRSLRRLCAAHPHLPEDLMHDLAWSGDLATQERVARNPSLPEDLAVLLASPALPADVRYSLACNPAIGPQVVRDLLVDPNTGVRRAAASYPGLDEATIVQAFAEEPSSDVRAVLVAHPNAPVTVLHAAAASLESAYRAAVERDLSPGEEQLDLDHSLLHAALIARPALPTDILLRLAGPDAEPGQRAACVGHPCFPVALLPVYASSPDPGLRAAAAAHPLADEETLALMAAESQPHVRFLIEHHPACTDTIRTMLALSARSR